MSEEERKSLELKCTDIINKFNESKRLRKIKDAEIERKKEISENIVMSQKILADIENDKKEKEESIIKLKMNADFYKNKIEELKKIS